MRNPNSHVLRKVIDKVLADAENIDNPNSIDDYVERGRAIWDRTVHNHFLDYIKSIIRYYIIRERTARQYADVVLNDGSSDYNQNEHIVNDLNVIDNFEQYVLDNGHPPPRYDIGTQVRFYDYASGNYIIGKVKRVKFIRGHHCYTVQSNNEFYSCDEINTTIWY